MILTLVIHYMYMNNLYMLIELISLASVVIVYELTLAIIMLVIINSIIIKYLKGKFIVNFFLLVILLMLMLSFNNVAMQFITDKINWLTPNNIDLCQ